MRLDPLYFVIYANTAALKNAQHKPREALDYAEKGLEINKTSVILIGWKARCLFALNRKAEALETMEKGLELTNRHQNLEALLCALLVKSGEKEKAVELYTELKNRSAHEYIAPYNLGRAAFALGYEAEAREMVMKAYQEKNPMLLTRANTDPDFSAFIDKLNLPK